MVSHGDYSLHPPTPLLAVCVPPIHQAAFWPTTFGMLSQVPGGAGVFEAAMFTLLAADLGGTGRGALAASLIAYRLVYYLAPLGVAMVVAAVAGARRQRPRRRSAFTACVFHQAQTATDAELEWLIDNATASDGVLRAIGSARRSIG